MRTRLVVVAAVLGPLLGSLIFFAPTADAAVVVPMLAGEPCVGSSLCSPETPAIFAELQAQGGYGLSGVSLSEGAAGDVAAVTADMPAATVAGDSGAAAVATTETTVGPGAWRMAGQQLLAGGIAAWALHLNGDISSLPAGAVPPASTASHTYSTIGAFSAYITGVTFPSSLSASWTFNGGVVPYYATTSYYTESMVRHKCLSAAGAVLSTGTHNAAFAYTGGTLASRTLPTVSGSYTCASSYSGTATAKISVSAEIDSAVDSYAAYDGAFVDPTTTLTTTVQRHIEQTISCTDASGGTTTVSNAGMNEVWSGSDVVTIAGLMCPAGYRATSQSSKVVTTGGSDTSVGSVTYPAPTDPANPCGLVGNVCLAYVAKLVNGVWTSCHVAGTPCSDWWTDPARSTQYECLYGTSFATAVVVGIGICSIYRESFPSDPVAHPPKIDPPTTPYDPLSSSCDLGWASVLDGTIVYKAVSCALEWAFVPDSATMQTQVTNVQTAFAATPFGTVSTAVGNFVGPMTSTPSGSSATCSGPSVDISWVNSSFTTPVQPLNVCNGLPKTIHDWAEPFMLIILWAAALMSSWFFVAQAFDMNQ